MCNMRNILSDTRQKYSYVQSSNSSHGAVASKLACHHDGVHCLAVQCFHQLQLSHNSGLCHALA